MPLNAQQRPGQERGRLVPASITAFLLAGTVSLLLAPIATAGVVVDPNGPASKQYSADLDRTRQESSGSPGDAGVPGSSSRAPLFGAGVTRANSGARRGSGQTGPGGSTSPAGSTSPTLSTSPTELSAGSSTVPEIAGISVVVLLAGGIGAFALRRWLAERAS